jgi:DNA-binding MarR family transcriptional regulator
MQNFDPSNSPAYQLWLATNAWQRCVRKALEPSGVTHCQFIILASIDLLREAGELPTQVAVHRFAQIDENMTSQVVKTLIAKGFIDRGRHPTDGRGNILGLSESGSELLKTARGVVRPAIDDFFGPLGDDRDHLTYLLRKLNEGTEFMIRSTKREAKVGD